MNLYRKFADRMAATPSRIAFQPKTGEPWTYAAFGWRIEQLAAGLVAEGVGPSDRVLVQTRKSVDVVALYLATLRIGAVYVPLNTAYTDAERAYFVEDADPTVIVCDSERCPALMTAHPSRKVVPLGVSGDDGRDAASLAGDGDLPPIATLGADDPAAILYTSGTTGRSKGAVLSHGALAANADALIDAWRINADDSLIHALPVFHIHGLFVALNTFLAVGGRVIWLDSFDADAVIDAFPRATVLMGVPTFYTRLLANPRLTDAAAATVRLFISGSAPLTPEVFATFEARTGHRILERYGMSEAGMIASNPLDGERTAGTVGFALPGVDLRIAQADGDGVGEVEIRGDALFSGYWRRADATAESFSPDGWFKTGDLGTLDAAQRLTLVGRDKDLIIVGGFNVYPKEIEDTLNAIDGVADSAVVAAPHPDMGEGVVVFLVADGAPLDEATLGAGLSALANFKRPRVFRWVDELPRNAMGKVQKQVLREACRDVFLASRPT